MRTQCIAEQMKPETSREAKNDKTEAVLLWPQGEKKAGFFGKDNNSGKSNSRGKQEDQT